MRQGPLARLELDTHAHDTDAGGGHVSGTLEEINVMLPFFDLGSFALFGIFFIINLVIQLFTGGLADLFPAAL